MRRKNGFVLGEDGERRVGVWRGGEFVEGELAAGGHYVAAAGVADESRDAAFDEMFLEDVDDVWGGFAEGQRARIPRDEIDFGGFERREEFVDALGVGERIVDAAEHDVLEHQVFPRAKRVLAAGLHQGSERVFFVDGHERVALFVVGSVERDGEAGADFFFGEFFDAGDDAAGGERGVLGRDRDAFGIEQEADRRGDVVEIEQRLTLPHQDDVGVGLQHVFVFFEREQNLRDDFAGREITNQAELRGEAKLAIDGAAGLRGDADGLAAFAGHENGFDAGGTRRRAIFAGGEGEKVADGTVCRVVALANDRERDARFVGEAFAEGGGERGHFRKVENAFDVEGLVELGAAVGGLAERDGEVGEFLLGFAQEFDWHVLYRCGYFSMRGWRKNEGAGTDGSKRDSSLRKPKKRCRLASLGMTSFVLGRKLFRGGHHGFEGRR